MFVCEDDPTLEQVDWKGCGFSICGDSEHLICVQTGPAAACSSWPCFEQADLTRWSLEVPLNLRSSLIVWGLEGNYSLRLQIHK